MKSETSILDIVSWFFGIILFVIGVLNIIQIHAIPGIIYIIFSFAFFPPTNRFFKNKLNFSISIVIKIIFFVLIMWFTLGVGDLAELYGL